MSAEPAPKNERLLVIAESRKEWIIATQRFPNFWVDDFGRPLKDAVSGWQRLPELPALQHS